MKHNQTLQRSCKTNTWLSFPGHIYLLTSVTLPAHHPNPHPCFLKPGLLWRDPGPRSRGSQKGCINFFQYHLNVSEECQELPDEPSAPRLIVRNHFKLLFPCQGLRSSPHQNFTQTISPRPFLSLSLSFPLLSLSPSKTSTMRFINY